MITKKHTPKIVRVELVDINKSLYCPFCGIITWDSEWETEDFPKTYCKHTLFVAHDEGFEYLSPFYIKLKELEGIDFDLIDTNGKGFDGFTDDTQLEESIKFAMYQPAPSFFGGYYGFYANA
jgi:hypothetical protein